MKGTNDGDGVLKIMNTWRELYKSKETKETEGVILGEVFENLGLQIPEDLKSKENYVVKNVIQNSVTDFEIILAEKPSEVSVKFEIKP